VFAPYDENYYPNGLKEGFQDQWMILKNGNYRIILERIRTRLLLFMNHLQQKEVGHKNETRSQSGFFGSKIGRDFCGVSYGIGGIKFSITFKCDVGHVSSPSFLPTFVLSLKTYKHGNTKF